VSLSQSDSTLRGSKSNHYHNYDYYNYYQHHDHHHIASHLPTIQGPHPLSAEQYQNLAANMMDRLSLRQELAADGTTAITRVVLEKHDGEC